MPFPTYFKELDLVLHDSGRGKLRGAQGFLEVAECWAQPPAIHLPPSWGSRHPGVRRPSPAQPAGPRCVRAPVTHPHAHRGKGNAQGLGVGAPSMGACGLGASRDTWKLGCAGAHRSCSKRMCGPHPAGSTAKGGRSLWAVCSPGRISAKR